MSNMLGVLVDFFTETVAGWNTHMRTRRGERKKTLKY
jgi:hypothetical protein